jgi:ABC-type dipeptide/oligopeptide/nickel transport system permease component
VLARFLIRRLVHLIPVLLGISVVVFSVLRLIPGDPAKIMAGDEAPPEVVEQLRAELGLDKPIYVQYVSFVGKALQGDLGESIRTKNKVTAELTRRFPLTVKLALLSTVVALLLGTLAGVVAAVNHNKWWDTLSMVVSLIWVSTPSYWLGLMGMMLFSLYLRWLPAVGASSWKHFVLPVLTLGAHASGIIARQTRSAMLDVLGQDYMRTARAKGLGAARLVFKHGLRNAIIPVITVVGLQFGSLLAGSVLVESVFNMPGLGRLMIDAISARDYPIVQGSVLLVATAFVLVNLIVDIAYAAVDPRIQYR